MNDWARGLRPRLGAGNRPTAGAGRRPIPPHFLRLLLFGAVLGGVGLDLAMIHRAEAAPAPLLNGAFADNNGDASGIQAGDRVTLRFDSSTNAHLVTKDNIDTVLALANSHTWLSGSGAIVGAIWSAGAFANDTLTITLSADGGPPTVAADDTISVAINTIRDASGQVDAVGTARAIVSTFGVDEPVAAAPVPLLSAVAVAGTQSEFQSASGDYTIVVPAAASVGDLLLKLTTVAEPLPPLPAGIAIAGSPISVQITFSATGLPPSDLSAALAVIVEAPTAALGSVAVTGLIAYAFDAADGWILLPSWVDADGGKLHVEAAESRVVVVATVTRASARSKAAGTF